MSYLLFQIQTFHSQITTKWWRNPWKLVFPLQINNKQLCNKYRIKGQAVISTCICYVQIVAILSVTGLYRKERMPSRVSPPPREGCHVHTGCGGVLPTVLLQNYRLLVLDPNFIDSRTHRTKIASTDCQFIKFFITKVETSTNTKFRWEIWLNES